MQGVTTAVANAVLNCYFNQTNITAPAAIYLGLSSTPPLSDGSGITEPSGASGYARKLVTASFAAAASRIVRNDVAIVFGPASADWSPVPYAFLSDHLTNPSYLWIFEFSETKTVLNGETLTVPVLQGGGCLPFTSS